MLRQIAMITWMNLKGLPARFASSSVVIVGIGGVVGVLVAVLAMAASLEGMLANTGSGDRVIVMREGATAQVASFLPADEVQRILATDGIARLPDGELAASVEIVTSVNVNRKSDNSLVDINLRGLDAKKLGIRPDIKLTSGRLFRSGLHEVIVGELATKEFSGMDLGDKIQVQGDSWEVVGIYKSGDAHESGMLTDVTTLMAAYERSSANCIVMALEDGVSADSFRDALKDNTKLLVDVVTEKAYYERAAGSITELTFIVTNVVGSIMALGALFGALNTMYTAVSARGVEIATLRALGFGATPVVISVLVESLLLAIAGALVGAALAWLFFSGNLVSISSIVFELHITPTQLTTGIVWACVIGALGGLFPAIRAARQPIVTALRDR